MYSFSVFRFVPERGRGGLLEPIPTPDKLAVHLRADIERQTTTQTHIHTYGQSSVHLTPDTCLWILAIRTLDALQKGK